MDLKKAQIIGLSVVDKLKPYCDRIEIAGSIRRKRPFVHDIDLVYIPSNQGQFVTILRQFGPFKMGGGKLIRVNYQPIELDVYIAEPASWSTLLLIRTGSAKHNVMLCSKAKHMGMKLHADGSGLYRLGGMIATKDAADGRREEIRVAGDTEESIFEALEMKYKSPEERE
jgi:DNA polymerase (family 10)